MYVFSTLNNKEIEDRILAVLPDGIEFVGELTDECEAAVLAARSISAGTGVKNVRDLLDKILERNIPCLLMARDQILLEYAIKQGLPEGNIINQARISIKEIADKVRGVICADDYEIILDDSDSEYVIEMDEKTPAQAFSLYTKTEQLERPSEQWESEQVINNWADEPAAGRTISPVLPDTTGLISPVAFIGVKGGVGVSTIVAAAADTMDDSIHLEIAGANRHPSAYCYYGRDPESTRENYVFWDLSKERPFIRGHQAALLDISSSVPVEAAEALIDTAGCLVLVTDRSEIAFEITGRMLRAGFKPDILVVNMAMSGVGNGMEVYMGEYEEYLQGVQVLELPGGLDEEKAIARAQRNGEPPCGSGKSVSLDTFAGELTSAIRNALGI